MTETARLPQLLASRLQALWGAAVEVTGVQRLPGGASRESWGVQARTADGAGDGREGVVGFGAADADPAAVRLPAVPVLLG